MSRIANVKQRTGLIADAMVVIYALYSSAAEETLTTADVKHSPNKSSSRLRFEKKVNE